MAQFQEKCEDSQGSIEARTGTNIQCNALGHFAIQLGNNAQISETVCPVLLRKYTENGISRFGGGGGGAEVITYSFIVDNLNMLGNFLLFLGQDQLGEKYLTYSHIWGPRILEV